MADSDVSIGISTPSAIAAASVSQLTNPEDTAIAMPGTDTTQFNVTDGTVPIPGSGPAKPAATKLDPVVIGMVGFAALAAIMILK